MSNSTTSQVAPTIKIAAHLLLVAVLCSLPHWVALARNRGDYLPFSVSPAVSALTFDETHAYAPPARRFMETGRIQAEADDFERRELSAGIPFIPGAILGAMGWTLRSLERAFIAADFIFPALLFLLYYAISRQAVSTLSFRLLIAWSSVLIPFGLKNTFWFGEDAFLAPLEITRTPQPEISFLFLLFAAVLLAKALRRESSPFLLITAGIASGVVVYCYYYYAVAWGITLGLVCLCGVFWRSSVVWQRTLVVISLMVVLATPFALATFNGRAEGGQTHLLARMGDFTHRPDWPALAAALALTLVLLFAAKNIFAKYPGFFVLATLITGALYGMNFQILSGFETQPWHFWKRLALPIGFFLAALITARAVENSRWRLKFAEPILLLVLIGSTATRLTIAGLRTAPEQRASKPEFQLLTWARTHLPGNEVIGTTDPQLILLIPALTTDYTYVPSGLRSLTSTAEIVDRYDELACLLGIPPSGVSKAAAVPNHFEHSTELMQVLGLTYTRDAAVERSFVKQYRMFSQHCRAPHGKLDYLILAANSSNPDPAAHLIYRNSGYQLLTLNSVR